jgi:P27 family predicted phage terminase small subunit
MPGGRKVIPENIKLLRGTHRPSSDRKTTKKQSKDGMQPQPWLPEDCHGYFEQIKEQLDIIGLNSSSYSITASQAAYRMVEIEECIKDIAAVGRKIAGPNGMVRSNPTVTQLSEAQRHLQSLTSELGLTPTALGKLAKPKVEDKKQGFGSL